MKLKNFIWIYFEEESIKVYNLIEGYFSGCSATDWIPLTAGS